MSTVRTRPDTQRNAVLEERWHACTPDIKCTTNVLKPICFGLFGDIRRFVFMPCGVMATRVVLVHKLVVRIYPGQQITDAGCLKKRANRADVNNFDYNISVQRCWSKENLQIS